MQYGYGPPGARKHIEYNGAELIAQDGTPPYRVVVRALARTSGLLWKKTEKTNRQFCYKPDSLYITHVFFIAQPPAPMLEECHEADLVVVSDSVGDEVPVRPAFQTDGHVLVLGGADASQRVRMAYVKREAGGALPEELWNSRA
eukprot:3786397-Alexandrium_andersonii.AAC.1